MQVLESFSGQGKIFLGKRLPSGMPGPLTWVGDALMEFGFTPNETKFKENWTGQRGDSLKLPGDTEANLQITFLEFNRENYKIATRGTVVTQDVTAVVDRPISATLPAVGDVLLLNAFGVGAVTVEDSTSVTPVTLTPDVNYRLDAKAGQIEILNLTTGGPFVGALKASFTPSAVEFIKMMSSSGDEYWVRFVGVNTVPGALYPHVTADFYRWSPPPSETMSLIQDGQSRLEAPLAGSLLADSTKTADDDFGYFGRMTVQA